MTNLYISTIRAAIKLFPDIVPHLKGRARWVSAGWVWERRYLLSGKMAPIPFIDFHVEPNLAGEVVFMRKIYTDRDDIKPEFKTYEYFLRQLERLVQSVYDGYIAGDFIDLLAGLIYVQLDEAYRQAWDDEGDGEEYPQYLADSFERMYLNQFDFVDAYYRAIIDARVDETPIDPLLARADQWAGQWDTAYKEAVQLIKLESGGNLVWRKGETEKGCATCASLDGIVAPARTWEALDVHPRAYPNDKLDCQGGGPANNCGCTLEETTERATRGAYDKILQIVSKG